jgi:hypothetical protein
MDSGNRERGAIKTFSIFTYLTLSRQHFARWRQINTGETHLVEKGSWPQYLYLSSCVELGSDFPPGERLS